MVLAVTDRICCGVAWCGVVWRGTEVKGKGCGDKLPGLNFNSVTYLLEALKQMSSL